MSPKKTGAPAPPKKQRAATRAKAVLPYYDFVDAALDLLPRLVVTTGPQHILASDVLARILDAALPDPTMRSLNLDEIDATDSAAVRSIPSKAAALAFLADRRAVVVRGAVDLKADDRAELRESLEGLPDNALVVVDHSGTPQRAQGRRLADEATSLAGAAPDGLVVRCELDARSSGRYVDEIAAKASVRVDSGARSLLAGSQDAAEIANVVERLALTAVKGRITADAVKGSIQPYDDIKFWHFTAAVHAGDADTALRLVRDVLDKPDEVVGPLFVLAADAIAIWELKHSTPAAYAAASGLSPFRVSALQSAARSATVEQAANSVTLTKRAIDRLFSGQGDPAVLLDELIVRMCALRRSAARASVPKA